MGQTVPFYQSVCESYCQACSTLFCSCCRVSYVSQDDFLGQGTAEKLVKLLEAGDMDAFRAFYPDLYEQHQPFCSSVTLTSCLLSDLSADLDELPEKMCIRDRTIGDEVCRLPVSSISEEITQPVKSSGLTVPRKPSIFTYRNP